ncbi:hypothetical protein [Kitasatospora herbaricolor]|uniref:Uncharacterized protein n=1 Tax=Kitasatospora herbaricolor TaxID=68217 RepID=A0ABZ1WLP6_9ACTN|nr:hypothetical protein [Kitasatospora herbaricolor]
MASKGDRRWAALVMGLFDLAWRFAEGQAKESSGGTVATPDDHTAPKEAVRAANLAMLEIYSEMAKAIRTNITLAQMRALGAGATYADVAKVRGVSRQAVRQDVDREFTRKPVVLSGGPKDGFKTTATVRQKEIEYGFGGEYDEYLQEWVGQRWRLLYRRSRENPSEFIFVTMEPEVDS